MKRGFVLAAILMALAAAAPAQQSAGRAQTGSEVLGLAQEWLNAEARNDRAALDRMIAEDFIGTTFGGSMVTKEDIVPPPGSGEARFPKTTVKETTAKVFGNTAVSMGRAVFDDPKPPGEFRFTLVYIKRDAGWQMVAAHLALMPRNK